MAVVISPWGFTFRDARGQVGRAGGYYKYTDTATPGGDALLTVQALGPLMHACSNAALIGGYGLGAEILNPDQYGASGTPYQTVFDKLSISWLNSENTFFGLSIPAPKSTQFQSDQETANPAATALSAFLAAMLAVDASGGVCCTRSGATLIAYVEGVRRRTRWSRRTTRWTYTPSLSGPEEG